MTFAIAFPAIDPVLIEFGPFAIRWYALAYIAGLVGGWLYLRRMAALPPQQVMSRDVDDFLTWATLGVVLGGRLGYVLFYKPGYYAGDPLAALRVWEGGMSFHGGFLGVVVAGILFCRSRGIAKAHMADLLALAAPIGLFFGRIANFINGELFGRAAPEVAWAMVFPRGGPVPRHPSQLYEAALEGLVLFIIVSVMWRSERIRRRSGTVCGVFVAGYGISRIIVEFFREPDAHLGFLYAGATMGQLLSVPMVLIGVFIVYKAKPQGD